MAVTTCPRLFVGESITDACRAADWAGEGVLPVAGGLLDQSDSFISFVRIMRLAEAEAAQKK